MRTAELWSEFKKCLRVLGIQNKNIAHECGMDSSKVSLWGKRGIPKEHHGEIGSYIARTYESRVDGMDRRTGEFHRLTEAARGALQLLDELVCRQASAWYRNSGNCMVESLSLALAFDCMSAEGRRDVLGHAMKVLGEHPSIHESADRVETIKGMLREEVSGGLDVNPVRVDAQRIALLRELRDDRMSAGPHVDAVPSIIKSGVSPEVLQLIEERVDGYKLKSGGREARIRVNNRYRMRSGKSRKRRKNK